MFGLVISFHKIVFSRERATAPRATLHFQNFLYTSVQVCRDGTPSTLAWLAGESAIISVIFVVKMQRRAGTQATQATVKMLKLPYVSNGIKRKNS